MDNKSDRQKQRNERLKYIRIQRGIRIGLILLALLLSIIALAQGCSTRRAIEDLAAQIRAKKLTQAQEELLAMQPSPSPSPEIDPAAAGTQVTLTFTGACAMGIDDNLEKDGELFYQHYNEDGPTYFFDNVKSYFEGDDLTACTLFGSITLYYDASRRRNWGPAFYTEPFAADVFKLSGIDTVNLGNSHAYDFDTEGYIDTLANLDNEDTGRFGYDIVFYEDVQGHTATGAPSPDTVRVGYIGVWEDADIYYETTALDDIAYLQDKGCQLLIVMIDWESKEPNVPDDKFIITAHKFIDAGADLIVGCNPDHLQGIEHYHGKNIVYSLGTLMTCDPETTLTDSFLFQQTFTLVDRQVQPDAPFSIIPCLVSGSDSFNDMSPVVAAGESQDRIMNTIYTLSSQLDGGISREDGGLHQSLLEPETPVSPVPSAGLIAPPRTETEDPGEAQAPEEPEAAAEPEEAGEPEDIRETEDPEETEDTGGVSETVGFDGT